MADAFRREGLSAEHGPADWVSNKVEEEKSGEERVEKRRRRRDINVFLFCSFLFSSCLLFFFASSLLFFFSHRGTIIPANKVLEVVQTFDRGTRSSQWEMTVSTSRPLFVMDVYNGMGGCGRPRVGWLFAIGYQTNDVFNTYQDCVNKCRDDPLCLKVQWNVGDSQCYGSGKGNLEDIVATVFSPHYTAALNWSCAVKRPRPQCSCNRLSAAQLTCAPCENEVKVQQNGNFGVLLGDFSTETTKLIVSSENGHVFSSDIDLVIGDVTLYTSEVTEIKRAKNGRDTYPPVVETYYPGGGFGPGYYGTLTTFESGPPDRRRQYLATSIGNDASSTKDSILYDVTDKQLQLQLRHVIAPTSLTPNLYTVRYLYQPAAALPFSIDGVQYLLLDQILGNPCKSSVVIGFFGILGIFIFNNDYF